MPLASLSWVRPLVEYITCYGSIYRIEFADIDFADALHAMSKGVSAVTIEAFPTETMQHTAESRLCKQHGQLPLVRHHRAATLLHAGTHVEVRQSP